MDRRRLRQRAPRGQLARRLDRASSSPAAGGPAPSPPSRPPGSSTRARSTGARASCAACAGLRENAPAPEPLLRNPVTRSLLAGPTCARPWRQDPDQLIEEMELFASCPGFDATLPHTFHAQPRGLTTLDVPVLILWGTLDVILLPRQGRRFERLIPGAELRYISGIGHVPMSDAPELLADAITEFALDRSSRAQAAALVGQDRDAVADDLRVESRSGRLSLVSPKRRLPAPSTTGNTIRRSSSTRPWSTSACTSWALPWTTMSPSSSCLSRETSAARSSPRTVRVGPLRVLQRRGDHVLRHVVELVRELAVARRPGGGEALVGLPPQQQRVGVRASRRA